MSLLTMRAESAPRSHASRRQQFHAYATDDRWLGRRTITSGMSFTKSRNFGGVHWSKIIHGSCHPSDRMVRMVISRPFRTIVATGERLLSVERLEKTRFGLGSQRL